MSGRDAADRWRSAHSRKRMTDALQAILLDPAEQRRSRAEVYRTDVQFADNEDPVNRIPSAGTAARNELVRRIGELKLDGLSHSQIGEKLGYDLQQISSLCGIHKITRKRLLHEQQ